MALNHFLLTALQFFYWPTKTKLDQTPMQISLFSRFTRICRVSTKNDKRFPTRDIPLLKALVWAYVPVLQGASGETWGERDSWCWCTPKASTIPPEWPACVFWVSSARKYPKHPLCLPKLHCAALPFCVPTENANTEGRPWVSCFYLQDQCHNLKVFFSPYFARGSQNDRNKIGHSSSEHERRQHNQYRQRGEPGEDVLRYSPN